MVDVYSVCGVSFAPILEPLIPVSVLVIIGIRAIQASVIGLFDVQIDV